MPPVPYPPIERHVLIGDRRTAALVAADGSLDWLCLPRYDSPPVLGALLDAGKGGAFFLGPSLRVFGAQDYELDTAVARTAWRLGEARLLGRDAMAWPQDERPPELRPRRAVVRTLSCAGASVEAELSLAPAPGLRPAPPGDGPAAAWTGPGGERLELWTSLPARWERGRVRATADLRPGQKAWAVLSWGPGTRPWSLSSVEAAFEDAAADWRRFASALTYRGPRRRQVRRSALTVRLLDHAPTGSIVAAPTTSLPEKIGGGWNADYRFAWLRDASLAMQVMSLVGDIKEAGRYLRWLEDRGSSRKQPLQVLYRVDGGRDAVQREARGASGYRGSSPVRLGNHAYKQRQLDSLGALADCVLTYHRQGGELNAGQWGLVREIARFTARAWRTPGNGIWELGSRQRWVSSAVMSWVCLDRAVELARRLGGEPEAAQWAAQAERIRRTVLSRGWSDGLRSFRQRLDAETLDASALLVPVMGFLPGSDRRVRQTVEAVARNLSINGFLFRFDPASTPGIGKGALGDFEGAFFPCTLWLATAYARIGRRRDAETVLDSVDRAAGPAGLLSEGVDARDGTLLGNYPLAFSHVEYVRAALALSGEDEPRHRGVNAP